MIGNPNLSKDVRIYQAITPTAGAAGTTAIEGETLDMEGYESVLMVVNFGAITAKAVTSIKAQQSSDDSTWNDLEGTSQTVADTDGGDIFFIDLVKPTDRYVRVYVSRATQNAVVACANYYVSGAKKVPVTHDTVVNGEIHISPAEGTA